MKAKASPSRARFWELPLSRLTDLEWELLCDGCGRCCLQKLQDEDGGQLMWTRIICRFFDEATSRCSCYESRTKKVPSCLDVRTLKTEDLSWMPPTCAYRLRMQGQSLPSWHPLLHGSRGAMEAAGVAVTGKVLSEEYVHPDSYEEHVIRWVEST